MHALHRRRSVITLNSKEIILTAAIEAQEAITQEIRSRTDITGTGFDQLGLVDGATIVREYLDFNETGVALDHLRYMIEETGIQISAAAHGALDALCDQQRLRRIRAPR